MKKTQFKKVLSLILCIVLIAAMALFTMGCNDKKDETSEPQTSSDTLKQETSSDASKTEIEEIGEGATEFFFNVVDVDGNVSKFKVSTDKTTVGEALLEVALIAGEEGPYGLYVKTVNGITLDYDKDGKYWAFYADGEMASAGVDLTDIAAGSTYEFKAE